jgi:hypothetical protein
VQDKTSDTLNILPKKVITRNYFAPLRTDMDTNTSGTENMPHEETVYDKTGRPPPIVLTSAANLNQLQKELKGLAKENFQFRSTRNETKIIKKNMADFQQSNPLRKQ